MIDAIEVQGCAIAGGEWERFGTGCIKDHQVRRNSADLSGHWHVWSTALSAMWRPRSKARGMQRCLDPDLGIEAQGV